MKKLNELTADEFFDVLYAATPIIPLVADLEIVRARVSGDYSAATVEQQNRIVKYRGLLLNGDKRKTDTYEKEIEDAVRLIKAENAKIFARDLQSLVPALTSRENRGALFEIIATLDGTTAEEVKKQPMMEIISKVRELFSDKGVKSLFQSAAGSDTAE